MPIRAAVAASLISVIATASASSTVNLEKGLVNMRLGLALEVATTIGGLAGLASSLLLTDASSSCSSASRSAPWAWPWFAARAAAT